MAVSLTTDDLGDAHVGSLGEITPSAISFARNWANTYDPYDGSQSTSAIDTPRYVPMCIATPTSLTSAGNEARKDSGGSSLSADTVRVQSYGATYQYAIDGIESSKYRMLRKPINGEDTWFQTDSSQTFSRVHGLVGTEVVIGIEGNASIASAATNIDSLQIDPSTSEISITFDGGHGHQVGDVIIVTGVVNGGGGNDYADVLNGGHWLLKSTPLALSVPETFGLCTLSDEAITVTAGNDDANVTSAQSENPGTYAIYQSTDAGDNFTQILGPGIDGEIAVHPEAPIRVVEGGDGDAIMAEYILPNSNINNPRVLRTQDSGASWSIALDSIDEWGAPTAPYQHIHPPGISSFHQELNSYVMVMGDAAFDARRTILINKTTGAISTPTGLGPNDQWQQPFNLVDFGHATKVISCSDGAEQNALIDLVSGEVDTLYIPQDARDPGYSFSWYGFYYDGVTYIGTWINDENYPPDNPGGDYSKEPLVGEIWATTDPTTPGWVCVARKVFADGASEPYAMDLLIDFAGERDGKLHITVRDAFESPNEYRHWYFEKPAITKSNGIYIEPTRTNEAELDEMGNWAKTGTSAGTPISGSGIGPGGLDTVNLPFTANGAEAVWTNYEPVDASLAQNVPWYPHGFAKADKPRGVNFKSGVGTTFWKDNRYTIGTVFRPCPFGNIVEDRRGQDEPSSRIDISPALNPSSFGNGTISVAQYQIEKYNRTSHVPGQSTRIKDSLTVTYPEPSAGKWADIGWFSPKGSTWELFNGAASLQYPDLHIKQWKRGNLTINLRLELGEYTSIDGDISSDETVVFNDSVLTGRTDLVGRPFSIYTPDTRVQTWKYEFQFGLFDSVTNGTTFEADRPVDALDGDEAWFWSPRWKLVIDDGSNSDTLYIDYADLVDQNSIMFVLQAGGESDTKIRLGVWNGRDGIEYSDWSSNNYTLDGGTVVTKFEDEDASDDEVQWPGAHKIANLVNGYKTEAEIESLIDAAINPTGPDHRQTFSGPADHRTADKFKIPVLRKS